MSPLSWICQIYSAKVIVDGTIYTLEFNEKEQVFCANENEHNLNTEGWSTIAKNIKWADMVVLQLFIDAFIGIKPITSKQAKNLFSKLTEFQNKLMNSGHNISARMKKDNEKTNSI